MKLLNQSIKYLSVSILFIISLWTVIFYFNMLNEIKESVDEGLENYKRQIINKAQNDTIILNQENFDKGFFTIHELSQVQALSIKDRYIDTLMNMQDADDTDLEPEPVRMLTSAFVKNGNYYKLSIVNSMVEEDDLIDELLYEAVWLYIILVGSIIIINNFVLQRLWKPFYDFLNQLESYRLGSSKSLPEVKTEIKEFKDLKNAVNILLNYSIETYDQQKQFVENASHELQTPLAIIINKLELLLEKGDLKGVQAENIAKVMDVVERLVRLNKSLLLLTKIENKQFIDNKNVSINNIIQNNIILLEEIAEFNNVKISVNEIAELITEIDVALANIIISNLIRNSIFHNVHNGIVSIEVTEDTVKIRNTGKNESLNPHRIFTRFYKSETKQSGTGLGLAIVKAICGLYGTMISYRFDNEMHCFEINFKSIKSI